MRKPVRQSPLTYTGGPEEWRKLCDSDLDLVFIVTPWELHAPMCVEAMRKGKHAATEVPMAPTLDECWQLVETSESTRRHCVMMENCCYDREEMMILNMVRQGVFGELLHAECGYLHDLRDAQAEPARITRAAGGWRTPCGATATCIPRTASARCASGWTSTAATGSSRWCR